MGRGDVIKRIVKFLVSPNFPGKRHHFATELIAEKALPGFAVKAHGSAAGVGAGGELLKKLAQRVVYILRPVKWCLHLAVYYGVGGVLCGVDALHVPVLGGDDQVVFAGAQPLVYGVYGRFLALRYVQPQLGAEILDEGVIYGAIAYAQRVVRLLRGIIPAAQLHDPLGAVFGFEDDLMPVGHTAQVDERLALEAAEVGVLEVHVLAVRGGVRGRDRFGAVQSADQYAVPGG